MMDNWGKWSSAEKIEAIISIWERGMSAGELAKAISLKYDSQVTRNAVVGIYHRANTGTKGIAGRSPLKNYPLNRPSAHSDAQRAEAARRRLTRQMEREAKAKERAELKKAKEAIKAKQIENTIKVLDPGLVDATYDASCDLPKEGYGVHMLRLDKGGCRWPTDRIGETTMFCNHPRHENHQYCRSHLARGVRVATPGERSAVRELRRRG